MKTHRMILIAYLMMIFTDISFAQADSKLPVSTLFTEKIDQFDDERTITAAAVFPEHSVGIRLTPFKKNIFSGVHLEIFREISRPSVVCHDKTSRLIIVFESGAKKTYRDDERSYSCDQLVMDTSFVIFFKNFLSEPISMMRAQFKEDGEVKATILLTEIKNTDISRYIETAVAEAQKILSGQMTVKQEFVLQ